MRVFAPERLWATEYYRCPVLLPETGTWIDVPDYFRQVTNGNTINDVVHAKLVDQVGDSYSYPDLTATVVGKSREFTQTFLTTNYSSISRFCYKAEKRFVEIASSPNYKGKKHRKRFVEKVVRDGFAYCVVVRNSSSTRGNWWYYTPTFTVMVLPEQPNPRYTNVGACMCEFTVRWTFTDRQATAQLVIQNYPDPTLIHLFDPIVADYSDSWWKWAINPKPPAGGESWREDMRVSILMRIESIMTSHGAEVRDLIRTRAQGSRPYTTLRFDLGTNVDCRPFSTDGLRSAFLLKEDYIFAEKVDPILLGKEGGLSHYWIEYLTQHALLEACDSLPRLSDNSISNIIEIVGFVKSLVVDHKIEIPKSLADAWLSYRYQYSTTKMDVQDAIKFVHRHMDLGTLDRMIVGRGFSSTELSGTTVVCRCSVEVTPKETNWLGKIWRALDTYGLTPDFYTIWDMVPYSFMVDWFLPIGDMAGVWDANSMYFSGEYYNLANICYSLGYVRELGDHNVKCYTRWAGSVPSSLNSFYWFEPPSASRTTVGRRVLDATSIFIG